MPCSLEHFDKKREHATFLWKKNPHGLGGGRFYVTVAVDRCAAMGAEMIRVMEDGTAGWDAPPDFFQRVMSRITGRTRPPIRMLMSMSTTADPRSVLELSRRPGKNGDGNLTAYCRDVFFNEAYLGVIPCDELRELARLMLAVGRRKEGATASSPA